MDGRGKKGVRVGSTCESSLTSTLVTFDFNLSVLFFSYVNNMLAN